MAKPAKTAKLVITSIVISIVVLAAFVLIFLNAIVPAYQITSEQIYSVLTKVFPVLIGLLLIQIGAMAAKKGEPEYKDTIDKLSPNAYDSPLYAAAKDDPAKAAEKVSEVIREVEVVKEVPVEVIKEVPVEIIKEVQVPVEVIKEVEVPVEVIKEVEVVKEVAPEPVYLSFHQVADAEAEAALMHGYDLSVAVLADTSAEAVEAAFEEDTLAFEEDGLVYVILPFFNESEARGILSSFSIVNTAELGGRSLSGEELIKEASKQG